MVVLKKKVIIIIIILKPFWCFKCDYSTKGADYLFFMCVKLAAEVQYSCYLDVFFLNRDTSEKEDPLVEAADDDADKRGVMASHRRLQDRVDSAVWAVINQVNRVLYSPNSHFLSSTKE